MEGNSHSASAVMLSEYFGVDFAADRMEGGGHDGRTILFASMITIEGLKQKGHDPGIKSFS